MRQPLDRKLPRVNRDLIRSPTITVDDARKKKTAGKSKGTAKRKSVWVRLRDEAQGAFYYFDTASQATSWVEPAAWTDGKDGTVRGGAGGRGRTRQVSVV